MREKPGAPVALTLEHSGTSMITFLLFRSRLHGMANLCLSWLPYGPRVSPGPLGLRPQLRSPSALTQSLGFHFLISALRLCDFRNSLRWFSRFRRNQRLIRRRFLDAQVKNLLCERAIFCQADLQSDFDI